MEIGTDRPGSPLDQHEVGKALIQVVKMARHVHLAAMDIERVVRNKGTAGIEVEECRQLQEDVLTLAKRVNKLMAEVVTDRKVK